MHHAYTLLVMASIVASAPTYASGSCLSYGHSCWGAHGKRSVDETRWFVSKLAPLPLNNQARLAHLIFNQQSRTESEEDADGNNRQLAKDELQPRLESSAASGLSRGAIKRLAVPFPAEQFVLRPITHGSSSSGGESSLSQIEDDGGFNPKVLPLAPSLAGRRDFILMGRPVRWIRFLNQSPKDLEEKIEE